MLKRGFSFAPGYRLEQFLGKGQFGQVWRASAPGGTAAAIKFIDLSGGEGAKEHEGIKRVKQIRHANLMPITAIWLLDAQGKMIEEAPDVTEETITFPLKLDPMATADSLPSMPSASSSLPGRLQATGFVTSPESEPAWLVVGMLLGGKSLQQRLRECVKNGLPGIPPKELLAYIDESAKGLDYLNIAQHDLGDGTVAIQHCDVKPANIVLIGSSAVVCDFGLARILSRNQVTATSAAGTPAYMAPEAISGKPCRTSDQYSLAVTYYHLRTGTLPVGDGTLWEILDAHRTGKLDLSRVSEAEQSVLKRATSLDWEQRFESNGDFVDAMREALRNEGLTRPIPSGSRQTDSGSSASLGSRATEANTPLAATLQASQLDPSMTLMPGHDITTPATDLAANQQDTKRVALSATTARSLAELASETPISIDGNEAWWLQPKWIAMGSIAIVAPMLLLVLLTETDSGQIVDPRKTPNSGNGQVTTPPENNNQDIPIVTERARFDEALKLDPSLSEPRASLLLGLEGDVMHLAFSGDSSRLVAVGKKPEPLAWPLAQLISKEIGSNLPIVTPEKIVGAADLVEDMQVDPSGKIMATADLGGKLLLTSLDSLAKPVGSFQDESELSSIAWSPDSDYLFAGTSTPSIIFTKREASRWSSPFRFDLKSEIASISIDPNKKWLLMRSAEGIVSSVPWSEIESLAETKKEPKSTEVSSTGSRVMKMLATRGQSTSDSILITGGEDGDVTFWTLGPQPKPDASKPHEKSVTAIAATPSGLAGTIATGDDNGVIAIRGSQSWKPLVYHSASITSLDLSDDGRWLAASSLDGDTTLWDLGREDSKMIRLPSQAGPANCVAMDSLGRWLAVGHSNGVVELWDLRHAKFLVGPPTPKSPEPTPSKVPKRDEGKSV